MPAEITQSEVVDEKIVETPEGASTAVADKATEEKKGDENAAPQTALEAAKAVMAKELKPGSAAKPQGEAPAAEKAAEGEKPKEGNPEDEPNLPFKDDPRWKRVASEARSLRVAKRKNEEAIAELSPKAESHDRLLGYFSENNLNQQDVANGLQIMAAFKNDPVRAYELLKPHVERLELLIGATIPPDIKAKVEAGTIDAETAAELARARAGKDLAAGRAAALEDQRRRDAEGQVQESEKRTTVEIKDALNSWGSEWAKRDPDAAKKQPLLEEMLEAAWSRKMPRNAEEARAQADEALERLNAQMRSFIPQREPKSGNLPVGGAPVNAAPVPKTALEAAKAALHAGR